MVIWRKLWGIFSTESPSFETPMFGRYFDTFQAAIHVAKAFPWEYVAAIRVRR